MSWRVRMAPGQQALAEGMAVEGAEDEGEADLAARASMEATGVADTVATTRAFDAVAADSTTSATIVTRTDICDAIATSSLMDGPLLKAKRLEAMAREAIELAGAGAAFENNSDGIGGEGTGGNFENDGPSTPSATSDTAPAATSATTTATTAALAYCATMALLRVLAFDHEGRPVQFDTWLDDLQLYLLSDTKDNISLFDHMSGAATAPPTTVDIARYSSPATAALGRLLLTYLFPELSAFATVEDLVFHLRASDARYRAAVLAEFLEKNQPPTFITLYFIVTRLPDSLRSVRDHFLSLDPTSLTVDLLEQHLLAAETSAVAVVAARGTPRPPFFEGCSPSPLAPSYASAAAADVSVAEDVGAASASAKHRSGKGKGGKGGGGGSGNGGGGSSGGGGGGGTGGGSGGSGGGCGGSGESGGGGGSGTGGGGTGARRVAIAALGASESGTLPGTAPSQALHTFTLDSGASACFFRDSTTLTPLSTPVPVRLAEPSGGTVMARSPIVLPCPARVTICTCTRTEHQLTTFTRRPGSSLYTLATEPPQVAASAQVSASGKVAASCSCRLLSHQTLLWHHRLGHPSLPRLRGMHSHLLVSGLPRSLPPLPPSPAPPCLPCVVAPHSSSFPPTTAPLQTLHMDVWGQPASVDRAVSATFCWWLTTTRVRLLLHERFGQDLPVLRMHSDKGGEFYSNLLRNFCRGEGILQSFTLPDSPQQNGIAERRIGLVMEVARTSMIHAAAPHFLWPFAVWYVAHQLNLWPRVSLPETSPTLRWSGEVGDASVFRVWGSRAFVRDTTTNKLSARSIPCGPTPSGVSPVDPLPDPAPVQVAVHSGAARGAVSGCAASGGAEPGGAESKGAQTGGAKPSGVETGGAEPGGAEPKGVEPEGVGGAGAAGAGGAGVAAGAGVTKGTATTGPGGARTRGTGAAGAGGVEGAGAGDPTESGATGADGSGAGGAGAGGAGAVAPGGAVRPRPYFDPLLQQLASPLPAPSPYTEKTGDLTERHEPASHPNSLVSTARRVPRSRPPPVPGAHTMALRPSSVPLHVPLPAPPESSLPEAPDPESDCARVASPTVSRLLATAVTNPSFESAAASALVAELLDFAATCRLDYATALVAESTSASPPSVGGECALGTDVLEDRQEDFECLAAAVPRFNSMLLAPERDPDAPDIPTPRSYAEAIMGPYSSQSQAAMDAEMASWKSTGTYVDEVPPPGANIVDGMWIFRVKRPPGSPPAFKARYVARGFGKRHGVNYFQTFSPTLKMTTLRVLLHVAAQRDYELQSLNFSTTFLQGSQHEEIWLRHPPGFTGTFPAGTQWSLRQPVYGLRQAPREWHDTLRTTIAALGFAPTTADPSLFLRTYTSLPPFYVLVYVDDLVFATTDTKALTLVKSELQKRHTYTDLGELRSYLSLQITRDRARRTITLTQSHMVHHVLQRFGFQFSSPQPTPLSTGHSLSAPPSNESVELSGPYPALVGCLIKLHAFLQGSLHEEIWLRRPPGFTGSFPTGTQWSLRRPVYGLRQVPREWPDTLRTSLAALGFVPSTADPSLFLRTDTSLPPFYVLVYVDDLVFATADTEALTLVKSELQKRHTCTDLGQLHSYLGLQITRDRARRTITLTQSHMVHQVLQRFGFTYSSPQLIPLSTSHSLSAPPSDESVEPSGPYPELVGCLMYLMTCTRPDLAYPLSLLARYVAPGRHRKVHWDAAKRVLRYLYSTSGMGLLLGGRGPVVLTGHADASWVDDSATQRSSQGYTFSLWSGSVSWRSTRSSSVLSSNCEAEIYAGAMAAQELRWLTYLLTDLGEQPRSPLVLYVDNKAMIAFQRGQLHLAYVATRANTADVFTKALPPGDHQRFVTVLGSFTYCPTLPVL
ncbi:unnamed protein product [Closterium sp. NIES-54]